MYSRHGKTPQPQTGGIRWLGVWYVMSVTHEGLGAVIVKFFPNSSAPSPTEDRKLPPPARSLMDALESDPTHQAAAPIAATTVPHIPHVLLQPRTAEHAMVLKRQLTHAAHQIPGVLSRRAVQPNGRTHESTRLSVTLPDPSPQILH